MMLLSTLARNGSRVAFAKWNYRGLRTFMIDKTTVAKLMTTQVKGLATRSTFKSAGARTGKIATGRKSLKETLTATTTGKPFEIGQLGVLIGSGLGLGALCFYGLGLSNQVGAFDKAAIWPEYVAERIRTSYIYLGASLAATAGAATMVARSPWAMNLVTRGGWMALAGTLFAVVGTGSVVRAIDYNGAGLNAKHLAWLTHTGVLGAVIAPLTLMGGPIMVRAAIYTAGVVGGLSLIAACAPSEKFLNMGGPLAMGLGAVFISSCATWFLPPTTVLGASLYSFAVYGGLVLFGFFLLHDTQRVVKYAESYPQYAAVPYDPINASMGVYLDTLNIFIRIAMILGGGGSRRK